jgi:hypothetical protein
LKLILRAVPQFLTRSNFHRRDLRVDKKISISPHYVKHSHPNICRGPGRGTLPDDFQNLMHQYALLTAEWHAQCRVENFYE